MASFIQRYPQRNEAGMEQNIATEVMMPRASSGPPKTSVLENYHVQWYENRKQSECHVVKEES